MKCNPFTLYQQALPDRAMAKFVTWRTGLVYLLNTRWKLIHVQVHTTETRTPGSRPSAQVPLRDTLRSSIRDINPPRDWSPGLMSVVAMFLRHVATQQELTIALTKPFLYWDSSSLRFSILILTRKSINNPECPWTFNRLLTDSSTPRCPQQALQHLWETFWSLCQKFSWTPSNPTSWRTKPMLYFTGYLHTHISLPLKTWKTFMLTSTSFKDILTPGYWQCWLQYLR